jgi:hypothetical protein
MATDTLERKKRWHRLAFSNITPDDNNVAEQLHEELGDVKIVDWEIEKYFTGSSRIPGGGSALYPQTLTLVIVNYYDCT